MIQQKISKEHSDRTKTVAGWELRFRYGGIDIRETLLGVLSCIKGTARVSEGSPGIDEEKKRPPAIERTKPRRCVTAS